MAPIQEQYAALNRNVALANFSRWVKLRFTGPDRKKFLNGLLTNNILKLSAGQGCPACLLTPKGLLRADLELYDRGEDLLALASPKAGGNIKEDLAKKVMLSATQMEDLLGAYGLFYLAGPKAPELVGQVFGLNAMARWEWGAVSWQGLRVELMAQDRLHPQGFWILYPQESGSILEKFLLEKGAPLGLKKLGDTAAEIMRVENGVPLYGVDMDEENIPLEAGLDRFISFDKGCYMGQETIARIHFRGHVNRVLVRLKISSVELPRAGAVVLSGGQEIGRLTSCVSSPGGAGILALALLRVEHSQEKASLQIRSNGNLLTARVLAPHVFTNP